MSTSPQSFAATMRAKAAASGKPLTRMSSALPAHLSVRPPLFVWIDHGRVSTSEGQMRGSRMMSLLCNSAEGNPDKRTLVLPTMRDARALAKALRTSKVRTKDELSSLLAGRHVVDTALTMPWMPNVIVLSRALALRYWLPCDQEDLAAVGRALGVGNVRSEAGMRDLLTKALRSGGASTEFHGSIVSHSEKLLRSLAFPTPLNDAQAFSSLSVISDMWKALGASDHALRPLNLETRVGIEAIPIGAGRDREQEVIKVPAGSIPFREGSALKMVESSSADRVVTTKAGKIASFGFQGGNFLVTLGSFTRGRQANIRSEMGRTIYLIEEPFGGGPRFTLSPDLMNGEKKITDRWENGAPPADPVRRRVPPELSLAGIPTTS